MSKAKLAELLMDAGAEPKIIGPLVDVLADLILEKERAAETKGRKLQQQLLCRQHYSFRKPSSP